MAELVSPGVSITVTDESFYAAAGTGTVPLIIVATGESKGSPDGAGVAAFTSAAEAGKVKLITSQRELLTNYGNPRFLTSQGTPLHGAEQNEYGLQAAYSFLGIANRAYVLRADVDLSELTASATAPTANPVTGSYWLNTTDTVWGLKRWNGSQWVRVSVKQPTNLASEVTSSNEPDNSFGNDGDCCVIYLDQSGNTLAEVKFYEKINGVWYHIGGLGYTSSFFTATHTTLPNTANTPTLNTGDMLLQLNSAANGTTIDLSIFDGSQFSNVPATGKVNPYEAYAHFDASGLTDGDVWVDYSDSEATITFKRWNGLQTVTAQSAQMADNFVATAGHTNSSISLNIIVNNSDIQHSDNIEVKFANYDSDGDGFFSVNDMVRAINDGISAADPTLTYSDSIVASNINGQITLVTSNGYDILLTGGNVAGFDASDIMMIDSVPYSNFEALSFESSGTEITGDLENGRLWYDSLLSNTNIDILYNNNGTWTAYPNDVQIAASEPTRRANGAGLQSDDLWVSSADLENYPRIYKYNASSSTWAEVDTTDQETGNGIVFADFRSSIAGLDSDAPSATEYPYDILAWNKRMSGGNVKMWDATNEWWVDHSGNQSDGRPFMLRKAQRQAVVKSMLATIQSNTEIRNESNRFNLIAAPGYPELLEEMESLSIDRKETAFVVGDAPLRLSADATSVQAWATNANNVVGTGEDGLTTAYEYSAIYYPHGLTTALDGSSIVVPASHIALRTLAYNDQVAFPWFAPAGFQRGIVTNADSVGYIDAASGEYQPVSLSEGQRDSLYINKINPIGQFPGRGLAVFGQKTLSANTSALDRVNVARLVVYIRERLDDIVKPFLFEPNDEITRQNAKVVVDRFLGNLVSQRGLFDFITVCDETNNTPERIDRNELHIDVAIQPVKAVEFIYIPIRVQNTLGQTN